MTPKQARALLPSDKVLWLWPHARGKPPLPGIVQSTGEVAVRIKWNNQPGEDTVFPFTDSSVWPHVQRAEPPKPIHAAANGRAKKTKTKRKTK